MKERSRIVKKPNNNLKKFFVNKFFIVLAYLKNSLKVIVADSTDYYVCGQVLWIS